MGCGRTLRSGPYGPETARIDSSQFLQAIFYVFFFNSKQNIFIICVSHFSQKQNCTKYNLRNLVTTVTTTKNDDESLF